MSTYFIIYYIVLSFNMIILIISNKLYVVSRIHDNVPGFGDLHSHPEVAQFVAKLMLPDQRPDAFKFVCFRCPAGMSSHTKLRDHCKSARHGARNSGSAAAAAALSCESCRCFFEDAFHLELHNLTLAHRHNFEKNAPESGDFAPPTQRVNHCVLCNVDAESADHIAEERHFEMVEVMRRYLKRCRETNFAKMFSVPLGRKELLDFLRSEKATAATSPAAKFLRHLFPKVVTDFYLAPLIRTVAALTDNPPQLLQQPAAATTDDSDGGVATSKSGTEYSDSISQRDIYRVTRCPKCHLKFDHATYMLVHSAHCHSSNIVALLKEECLKHREDQGRKATVKCARCMRACASPLVFAIHHDQHHAPRAIACANCELKYKSWAQFYRHDTCKRNSVPEAVKAAVEEAVNSVLARSVGGVVGGELLAVGDTTAASEEEEEEDVNVIEDSDDNHDVEMEESPEDGDNDEEGPEADPKLGPRSRPEVKLSKMDRHMAEVALQYMEKGRKRGASSLDSEASPRKKPRTTKLEGEEDNDEEDPPKKKMKGMLAAQVMIGQAERAAAETEAKARKAPLTKKPPSDVPKPEVPQPKSSAKPETVAVMSVKNEKKVITVKNEKKVQKDDQVPPATLKPAVTNSTSVAVKAMKKEKVAAKYSAPNKYAHHSTGLVSRSET